MISFLCLSFLSLDPRRSRSFSCGPPKTSYQMSLRAIQKTIQSYGNINKITSSLKLVSAAKMAKTERLLKDVRPFGYGTLSFYKHYTHINMLDHIENHLIFAITSDRGLCGGIHVAVVKKVKQELDRSDQQFAKVVCVGKKSEELLAKSYKSNILFTVFKIGKNNATFLEASKIFNECNYAEFIACQIFYNRVVTKGTSQVDWISIYNTDFLLTVAHIASLEEVEEETMKSYIEFSTVSLLFFAMVENAFCEHSARMIAMDAASKNVKKLNEKLSLEYNRKRQFKITSDLIDIVSGSQVITEK
ncbi:ATP synthase subunit gamma, mitochondrial-like [Myzus persicae]|uniref:ATP synthase subunit gamma, mitochondrial-like n=1 Tax=Myzus persicae TaxID=13164 RepID=UPI000B932FD8|nr:ATP synthase subunit gamma, mitochondrial-like [Myzus persicae]